MLVMFLLAVVCGWAALYMVFDITLWNILLGILAAFFLLRGLELADRINKYGPHSEDQSPNTPPPNQSPRYDEGVQEEVAELDEDD